MKKLRPEKESGVTKIHSPPSVEPAPYAEVPKCPCPGASPRNQGRPPCPQRVQWHIKCHLHNSHKPTLPYAAHGKRTRATVSQSITHPHSLYFISGPGILPLDSFKASKCPLTLNTERWTRSLGGTDHRLSRLRGFLRGVCVHGPWWGTVTGRMKGWDNEVGGMREEYNDMRMAFISHSENDG